MINRILPVAAIIFSLTFTSCVTKKKYLDMQEGRMKAEQQARELTRENDAKAERIKVMVADFEAMKNELMASNAEKDQYIDNLNKEMASLNDQLNNQKESLQSSTFTYSFEKDRLAESLEARDKSISSLESKIKNLEQEIILQSSQLSDRNIRINSLNDQMESVVAEKERILKQSEDLQLQIQKLRADTEVLRGQLVQKDETIARLQNNVNLLKKQVGGEN
jgi:chromosome segregation ATPase